MSPGRILIVDDEPHTRQTVGELLKQFGYEIAHAASGGEALMQIGAFLPDTILLDVLMPGMDGFEVCQRVKEHEQWRHIPIILVTGLDSKADMAQGFEVGADDFLQKPLNAFELQGRIRSMLRIKKQYDALKKQTQNLTARVELHDELAEMIVNDSQIPLKNLFGATETLNQQQLPASEWSFKVGQAIKTIRQEINWFNQFMNELVLTLKTETGTLILNQVPLNLDALIHTCIDKYTPIATVKNIHLMITQVDDVPAIHLDSVLFERVVDILLLNAIRTSTPGSVVKLSLEHPHRAPGFAGQTPQLALKIKDQSQDMLEEYRQLIFEAFDFVNEPPTLTMHNRLQAELTFCKKVLEAHNGQLLVELNEVGGATFIITL